LFLFFWIKYNRNSFCFLTKKCSGGGGGGVE